MRHDSSTTAPKRKRSFKEWAREEQAGPLVSCALAIMAGTWTAVLLGFILKGTWTIPGLFILSLPALLVFGGLFSYEANPLKWWSMFYGVDMRVKMERVALREQSGESSDDLQAEILAWVQNCAKRGYIRHNPYFYRFRRKSDAMMFKLAWG